MNNNPYFDELPYKTKVMLLMVNGDGAVILRHFHQQQAAVEARETRRKVTFYTLWCMLAMLGTMVITSICVDKRIDWTDSGLLVLMYVISRYLYSIKS
jgi:hypothetical protein